MVHVLIGVIVGIIMGLTGSGGALISIPLFLYLLQSSQKEATVLSLLAVIFSTSSNLLSLFKKVNWTITLSFMLFGAISSYASLYLKAITPDWVVIILLTLIALFGLWSLWRKPQVTHQHEEGHSWTKMIMIGLLLGVVTTLTGLGGGVLLVPILIMYFNMNYEEALPTSLATILLISLTSFGMQFKTALGLITVNEMGLILIGTLVSLVVLKAFTKAISKDRLEVIRKVVFTLVTVYAIGSIIYKAM